MCGMASYSTSNPPSKNKRIPQPAKFPVPQGRSPQPTPMLFGKYRYTMT